MGGFRQDPGPCVLWKRIIRSTMILQESADDATGATSQRPHTFGAHSRGSSLSENLHQVVLMNEAASLHCTRPIAHRPLLPHSSRTIDGPTTDRQKTKAPKTLKSWGLF